MTLRRHVAPQSTTAYAFSILLMLLLASTLMGACNRSQRNDTLRTTVISVNAARDGFTAWDRNHQQAIAASAATREAAESELTKYRSERETTLRYFEVAYRSLALAATQVDEPSLKTALISAADVVDAVKALMMGVAP